MTNEFEKKRNGTQLEVRAENIIDGNRSGMVISVTWNLEHVGLTSFMGSKIRLSVSGGSWTWKEHDAGLTDHVLHL